MRSIPLPRLPVVALSLAVTCLAAAGPDSARARSASCDNLAVDAPLLRGPWDLAEAADAVVLASVAVGIAPATTEAPETSERVLELRVRDVLKGRVPKALTLRGNSRELPSRWVGAGTTGAAIAFLVDVHGCWQLLGRRGLVLVEDGAERQIVEATRAALRLQRRHERERVDWLIDLACEPATARLGLAGLARHLRLRGDSFPPPDWTLDPEWIATRLERFAPEARARLADCVVGGDLEALHLGDALLLLRGVEDPRLDAVAVELLEELLARRRAHPLASRAVFEVLARFGVDESDGPCVSHGVPSARACWEHAIVENPALAERLGLP